MRKIERFLILCLVVFIFTCDVNAEMIYYNPVTFKEVIGGMGASTTINFDEIDSGAFNNSFLNRPTFDGNYYLGSGVSFASMNGYPLYIAPGGLFWNSTNSLSVWEFPYDGTAGNDDDSFIIRFSKPQAAVGFTLVDPAGSQTVKFFDGNGKVIASKGLSADYSPYRNYIGLVSPDQPISSIIVYDTNNADDVNYDDFLFVPAEKQTAAPEPSSVLLVGSALLSGYLAFGKKRRNDNNL